MQAPFDSELKTRTSARRGAAQVTGAVWVAAATFALAPQVRAESEARCPITYEAPDACPSAAAMAKAAGPHFRVMSGSAPCPNCVSRITITAESSGGFSLHTGDEFTHSADCAELVKIAGFTVRSSHIHRDPPPKPPFLFLGLHAGQVIASDLQWLFGSQLGVRLFDSWLLRSHAGWMPESRVQVLVNENALDPRFVGYQAGLDVCRDVKPWVAACALTSLEWFRVSPTREPVWQTPFASQLMIGLGATLQTPLVSELVLQVQPGVLFAPRPATVSESDWSAALYERPHVQVQLRAGLAWGFGATRPTDDSRSNFAQTDGARITH